YKIIDKTTHKSLLPSFKGLSRLVVRIGIPVMVICALVAVPAYLGQRSNHFLYGAQSYPVGTREARDSDRLNDQFGENMQMALLVPKGQWAVEQQLAQDLLELPEMKSSMGYVTQVGTGIPPDILPDRILSPLISEHYSRLILIAESPAESPETYELAQTIREMVDDAYPEGDTHLAGANFVMFDMKTTINQDLPIVNGLAILAIALVIMLAFRSVALPLILVMTIELSIWINLAIPYLTGTPLNFIGYLVISTVQLGATVDYGILMAQHYVDHRQLLNRKQAAMKSVQTVAGSIIPPALILAAAGFILYFVSSISVVSELGIVLGRGALISLAMVLFLLPNLLRLFDRFIDKTTWKLQMAPDPHSYRRQPAENKSEFDTIKEIKPVNTGRNRMNRIRLKKRKNERGRNWGKYAAGLMAITVFLSFMPGLVRADKTKELITLPNNNSGKREVVYGKLSASGNVEQIYVVNHFHPKDKTALTDYGDYESVIQLTGTVAPLVSNSTVTIAEVEGPYYYQGNLISREIPWNFEIAYRLNGEKRLPETLSGESGRLEMALEISQNEAVDPVFFDHYALQISIPIDPDRVIIEAASEGFLVASGGTEHQLNYIVLPGQETTIKLVLDVNDYAMGQITLAGVLLSFDMDLSEMEDQLAPLDDLSSGIADFAEGADRLNAGYRDLQNAFKAIVAGSGQLADGGRQLDQGVQELAKGSRQLLNEGSQLTSGYGELLKNFKTIISGSGELVDGGRQLDQGVQELAKGSRLLLNEGANLKAGSQDILDGLTQITDNLPSSDVFESLEIPEFGEEDMQRLEQVVEYLDMLVPLLDRLLEYEDELEDLRALVNELIGWLNQIEIPDQGGAPVTQEQWRAYFEGLGIDIPEGAESLYEQLAGLSEAAAGNAPALERIKELLDELVVLSKDIPELDMSVVEMIDEIKALVGQAKELMELIRTLGPMFSHFGELIDGLNELQTGYVQFHAGLVQYIDDGVGGITEGLEGTDSQPGLASGSTEFVDGVASLNSGLNQYYSDGLVKFSGGLDQYIDRGVGGITAGLEGTSSQPGLASGAADYVDGVASLRKGLVQYNADGLVKFSGGIAQLSDGASILKNETSGLRQVFEDAIREQLDQFGNVGFETVSFVSDKNKDVSSVQFVFMTEEIPPVNGK
ncbi:MAG TPA: MMPL family transporter, partial [Clostridia bacterium]|nr:MMPL family transporter [Clostridia bacterium]